MSVSDVVPFIAWFGAAVVIVVMYRGTAATTKAPSSFAEVDPTTLDAVEFFWRPG